VAQLFGYSNIAWSQIGRCLVRVISQPAVVFQDAQTSPSPPRLMEVSGQVRQGT